MLEESLAQGKHYLSFLIIISMVVTINPFFTPRVRIHILKWHSMAWIVSRSCDSVWAVHQAL